MERYNTLSDALTDLGWFHIDNIEIDNKSAIDQINGIVNLNETNFEGIPTIKTEQKTVIVCDNHDFNETYLIDIVSAILKNSEYKPGDLQLVYIDNITARQYIENPKFIQYHNNASLDELKTIERNYLHPQVIVINPNVNAIVNVAETEITQVTEEAVKYIIKYLDDNFAKNQIAKETK